MRDNDPTPVSDLGAAPTCDKDVAADTVAAMEHPPTDALRMHAAALDAVIQSLPDAVYVATEKGVVQCNAPALRMAGVGSPEELRLPLRGLGERFRARYAAEGRPVCADELPLVRALRGESIRGEELIITRLDSGEDLYVRSTAAPIVLGGQIVGAVWTIVDTTRPKRAGEELMRSEAMLAEAEHLSRVGSWNWDLRTNDITWSDEHYRILGLRPQETRMTPERAASYIHPADRATAWDAVHSALQDRRPYEWCLRIVREDGTVRVAQARGRPVYDDGGNPVRMHGTMQDVTELAEAQEKLRRNESQLAEAQQLAHVGSWNWDLQTDLLTWSDEHYRICGMARQDGPMTFEHGIRVIHPDDRPRVRRTVDDALRDHTPYECSLRLLRPDGSIRFVHSRGRTVLDPAGEPVRMYGTLQDVTERVRAEEALRVANEQLDLAIRGSNIGIWDVDLPAGGDYRRDPVRFFNVWEQLGYAPAEFPVDASASRSLAHPDDLPWVDAAVAACLAGESDELRVENRVRHKDGTYHWLLTLGKAIRDASGTPVRLIGTILDITDRKRHEAELQRTGEVAEAANRSKDEFLAVVSHELRTPLGAILLWSEMLAAGTVNPAKYHDAFRAIRESALAQHRLIEDLLDVSKMLSGDFRLNARDQEMAPVVRAAIDTVRPSAEAKGIEIAASFDESAGRVTADSYRMQQVVWNLVTNAVKFSDQGGRVTVTVRRVRDFVQVRVADTGKGIAPGFLPYVFDRFRQADSSSTRANGGLGLGLAIVRRLVELHGGTVTAESPGEGGGSTFTVGIPLADARFPSDGGGRVRPASGEPAFAPSPVLRGARVLLVEDEPQTRMVVQWVLEQCEAEVTAVEDASHALEAFRAAARGRHFDAMLSDIGMPGQNGYELMRRVRALEREAGEPRPLPAVALTAYAGEEERKKALEAGFFLHLPKPIGPSALVRAVAKAIGQGGAKAEPH